MSVTLYTPASSPALDELDGGGLKLCDVLVVDDLQEVASVICKKHCNDWDTMEENVLIY